MLRLKRVTHTKMWKVLKLNLVVVAAFTSTMQKHNQRKLHIRRRVRECSARRDELSAIDRFSFAVLRCNFRFDYSEMRRAQECWGRHAVFNNRRACSTGCREHNE